MPLVARIYRPAHVVERITLNGKLISCGEASAAMLVDAATFGELIVTERRIRAMSSEPIPDPRSPGLNLYQLDDVLERLGVNFSVRTGDDWGDLVRFLRDGRRAILQLDNWRLGSCGRSRVGHAVFAQAYSSGRVLVNNPLCTRARWLDAWDVRQAMEIFATSTGVPGAGLRFGISRRLPKLAVMR